MRRPLLPALLLITLSLAACGQAPGPAPAAEALVPAASAPPASTQTDAAQMAGVTLRLPAPAALRAGVSAQYVNALHTTSVSVQIDGAAAKTYTLGTDAPCADGLCTLNLGLLSPGRHTFTVGTSGVNPASGATVLISQGSAAQTLIAGQNTAVTLTLTPVNVKATLESAVKQYDSAAKTLGNYVRFTVLDGHSLPAYYDLQVSDSVGDSLPAVLCSPDGTVAITPLAGAAGRYRVEMTGTGPATLNVRTGTSCGAPATAAAASLAISGAPNTAASLSRTLMGGYQFAAIKPDGSVVGWGNAVPAAALTRAVTLADNAASDHGMALLDDGTIAYWGYDGHHVTATPSTLGSSSLGTGSIVALGAGYEHSAALLGDGTVWAWGDGVGGSSTVPANLRAVARLAVGYSHNLALKSDGSVAAWGDNLQGESAVPPGLGDVVAVAAGQLFSLALRADGTVSGWGDNTNGQLSVPPTLDHVVAVAAGTSHALALRSDGTVVAWGSDLSGQATVPAGLGDVVAIAGGADTSLALKKDGSVVAWGAVAAPSTVTAPGSVRP